MTSLKILSTKKLSEAFHHAIRPGWKITEQELININPLPISTIRSEVSEWIFSPDKKTVVFTSQHAVISSDELFCENGSRNLPDWEVFCLSGATQIAVSERLPQLPIVGTADNASDLAEKIIQAGATEVLFFCGNIRRNELPEKLQQAGILVREITVYETELKPVKVENDFDVVLFFSPSAVESFFALNSLSNTTACVAIGDTTADTAAKFTNTEILVADKPTQDHVLQVLKKLANKMKLKDEFTK